MGDDMLPYINVNKERKECRKFSKSGFEVVTLMM